MLHTVHGMPNGPSPCRRGTPTRLGQLESAAGHPRGRAGLIGTEARGMAKLGQKPADAVLGRAAAVQHPHGLPLPPPARPQLEQDVAFAV